ncbi:hypothetical protein FLM08_13165 [Vibrio cholerae]|uniref:hypothetical protein n=1 Tax=Vibrio cholerae TaxID=666 RepID=UPI001159C8CC|nr:hypothetical protein [Vibrio cholerae]TQO63339.1 hypothetical protein FLM08_13165 [Vibrio cholerae]
MSFDYDFEDIIALDDELLLGGVFVSEWCTAIVREADIAYVSGAYLGAILTAVAGIETHIRGELQSKKRLVELINDYGINDHIKQQLHELRKYRNSWVHVDMTEEQDEFADNIRDEMKLNAYKSIRLLRQVLYSTPWV